MSVKMIKKCRLQNLTMHFNDMFFSVDFKIDKNYSKKISDVDE